MSDSTEKADQAPEAIEEQAADLREAADEEAGDSVADVPAQLAEAQEASEENYRKYLLLAAELENLRRRTVREVAHARKYGTERLANELLAVVDSLEMGLDVGSGATAETLLEGNQATLKLLIGALAKSGIEELDPQGEPFDPNVHEAMTMQPSDTVEPGSVVTVVQKGYQINGRLLRPARVIVASEPAGA